MQVQLNVTYRFSVLSGLYLNMSFFVHLGTHVKQFNEHLHSRHSSWKKRVPLLQDKKHSVISVCFVSTF